MSTTVAGTARSALVVLAVVALLTAAGCREGKEAAAPPAAEPATTGTQPMTQPPQETVTAPEPAEGNVLATVRAGETPPVAGCPLGSSPWRPGPAEQARPSGRGVETAVAFDRQSARIVALDSTRAGPPRTWTFDVCTNTWQATEPQREPELFDRPLGRLIYDADSDLTILFPVDEPTRPWAYSVETNAWTEQPIDASAPTDRTIEAADVAYDPVSGLVVIRDERSGKLWAYDVETNTWTEVGQDWEWREDGGVTLLAYDASVDKLVLALQTETWLFDPRTGAWVDQKTTPPAVPFSWVNAELGGEITFDEATERTVVFSDGVLATYDAAANDWRVLQGNPESHELGTTGPLNRFFHAIVYDPVNERIVLYGGEARMPAGWRNLRDVWAFDPRTREWSELVPQR